MSDWYESLSKGGDLTGCALQKPYFCPLRGGQGRTCGVLPRTPPPYSDSVLQPYGWIERPPCNLVNPALRPDCLGKTTHTLANIRIALSERQT